MRKQFFAIISMTAAALAVLSCAKVAEIKDEVPDNNAAKGFTVNVRAGEDLTRTMAVDGEVPTIEWTVDDKVLLFEVVDGAVVDASASETALIDEEGRASFVTPIDWDDAGTEGTSTYQYSAVYPGDALFVDGGEHLLFLPDNQNLIGNNFSADSDLLISTVLDHGNTRATPDEDIMFSFRRVGTVVRLRLKGIPEGAGIDRVILEAPVNIAGTINYDPITGKVDPASAFEIYGTNRVELIASDLVATGDDVIWFRVMCDEIWAAGEEFVIQVDTDLGFYEKKVTLPVNIRFPDGGLTRFGVDLSDVVSPPLTVPVLWDFEEGAPGWTFTDEDGDGYNWDVSADYFSHSGDYVLRSQSYDSDTYDALTPDNWAFTPRVQLTEGNYLSFWIRAEDVTWGAEHYQVYIESDSGELTTLIEETEYPAEDYLEWGDDCTYQHIVVQIPAAFDDQIVRIVFRHFNCENQDALDLDDVEILEEAPVPSFTADYADYLGEWTDGYSLFTIEQKEEGSTFYISGFVGQQYPVEAVFMANRLVVYEQVVNTSGSTDITLQGLIGDSFYTNFSLIGLRVIFTATYDANAGALNLLPINGFTDYIWLEYDNHTYAGYGTYDSIPDVLVPYVIVPDTNTYIYQESFESGTDGWTFFDRNEDGSEWMCYQISSGYAHSGDYVLWSRSYESGVGVTPDNYAFTPAITLTNDNYLSFWVAANKDWCEEHFAVYVTTEAPSDSNLPTSDPIFEQIYSTSATVGTTQYLVECGVYGYQHYVIPLDGFDNQTVYFGFRHFDCYDQNYLLLDDVGVIEGTPVFGSAPAQAAPRKVAAPKVQGRSIRRESPKAQVSVIRNEIRKSR